MGDCQPDDESPESADSGDKEQLSPDSVTRNETSPKYSQSDEEALPSVSGSPEMDEENNGMIFRYSDTNVACTVQIARQNRALAFCTVHATYLHGACYLTNFSPKSCSMPRAHLCLSKTYVFHVWMCRC